MVRNVTIPLPEEVADQAERLARGTDRPLSDWLVDLVAEAVQDRAGFEQARREAMAMMEKGFPLGGKPLRRDEIYGR